MPGCAKFAYTMPRSASSYARVELDAGAETELWPVRVPDSDTPFRIALLGDFTGRGRSCDPSLSGRRFLALDRDNFELVMERLAPALGTVRFTELDDFHPDRLYERLPIFAELRGLRERLEDRSTFQQAAAEVQGWKPRPEEPAPAPDPDLARLTPDQLLDRMLGDVEPGPALARRRADPFDQLLREIVAPYGEPKPDPRQPELVARVDEAISAQMRAILHHPEFQALEAAWRGLFFLVRRLETGALLKLSILDISKAELAGAAEKLYELIVEQSVGTPGAPPWALVAGLYTFDDSPEDLEALRGVGRLARAAGAPFLAAASPRLLGCASLAHSPDPRQWQPDAGRARLWQALRRAPEAGFLGLALPRFLLRLPYGNGAGSTDAFSFEEMPNGPEHESYLWGNPALACVALLGEAFSRYGWEMRPDRCLEVEGLPVYLYRKDGEPTLQPCAEALLTERAADAIMERGLMPLLTIKDSDRARLARFQSIADPPSALAARWG